MLKYGVLFSSIWHCAPACPQGKVIHRVKSPEVFAHAQPSMKPETPKKAKTGAMKAPKPATAATATESKSTPTLPVPSILLEGDAPSTPTASGPGQRYALGPTSKPEDFPRTGEPGELPEAYGTKRLHLTARDPYWVYAHWDLT